MIGQMLLLLALGAPAVAAQPTQACAWLNAGTAASILRAEVTASVHSDSNWSGSCRFVSSIDPTASINVVVSKTDSHRCGAGATQLTGIGNEAALCSARDASGRKTQTISGRVRDAWFIVVLVTSPESSKIPQTQYDSSASASIEFLAEQVAGNLY